MRVGAIQSNYIPWRGYFDFIASVDVFVVCDDVEYSRKCFRNRNRIKTPHGLAWLTVPVRAPLGTPIDHVPISPSVPDWAARHRRLLVEALRRSPHGPEALALWEAEALAPHVNLSTLNLGLLRAVCRYLGISTPLVDARSLGLRGRKTERIIDLMRKLGGRVYLSGPSAASYLDVEALRHEGLGLEYKSYDHAPYPQPWGPFEGQVTVLDLIANVGPRARALLTSHTPNVRVC